MQLKLLNFHKVLSLFASNIVGAFIALIIYQSTQSFAWAFVYMIGFQLLKVLFSQLLYKPMQRKPQLFLLLTVIPFLIYSLSILLLDTDLKLLGIFLVLIFQALSDSFKELPMDFVYNYCSNGNSSSTGLTRFFEYLGKIIAFFVGGLLLDYLAKWIVVIVACSTYLISVIPLYIYYLKNKHKSGFNVEGISNAVESFRKIRIKKRQLNVISKKVLATYFFVYFVFCAFDAMQMIFSLYLFKVSAESYSYSSYIQIACTVAMAIGIYLSGKWDEKKDLTKYVCFCSVIVGVLSIIVPFVTQAMWLVVILFAIMGFFLSTISLFCYSRMVSRCTILGRSNTALLIRMQSSRISQIFMYIIATIFSATIIPAFFAIGTMMISGAYVIPQGEEYTRNMMVDYLNNNKMY